MWETPSLREYENGESKKSKSILESAHRHRNLPLFSDTLKYPWMNRNIRKERINFTHLEWYEKQMKMKCMKFRCKKKGGCGYAKSELGGL